MGDEMNNEQTLATALISLTAETHIHSGIGQSSGALDLPVARERTTHYPFVPGSGVKGAFRVWSKERATGLKTDNLFGKAEEAGDEGSDAFAGTLLCSDARLLLLPVRCLSDAYKWVTCPAILKRLKRDIDRNGHTGANLTTTCPNQGEYLGPKAGSDWLGLEEREFEHSGDIDPSVYTTLKAFIGPDMADVLEQRLIVLSDKDFTWFAQYALPVAARNALTEYKISEALWYEETLAPDTIMYCLFGERKRGAVKQFTDAIKPAPYVQIGGNETIGQGWFKMHLFQGAGS